jgi:hypothetical protein
MQRLDWTLFHAPTMAHRLELFVNTSFLLTHKRAIHMRSRLHVQTPLQSRTLLQTRKSFQTRTSIQTRLSLHVVRVQ